MRSRSTNALAIPVIVSLAFCASQAHAQKIPQIKELVPGQYSTVIETNNPGLPVKIPPVTQSQCISAKDLDEGRGLQAQKEAGMQCTYSDIKSSAGAYTFKASCKMQSGMTMAGDYDVKASGNKVTMNIKQKISGANIPPQMANNNVKMVMTRVGDCAAKK